MDIPCGSDNSSSKMTVTVTEFKAEGLSMDQLTELWGEITIYGSQLNSSIITSIDQCWPLNDVHNFA